MTPAKRKALSSWVNNMMPPVRYVSQMFDQSCNYTSECKQALIDFSSFSCPPLSKASAIRRKTIGPPQVIKTRWIWNATEQKTLVTHCAELLLDEKSFWVPLAREWKAYILSPRAGDIFWSSQIHKIQLATLHQLLTFRSSFFDMDGYGKYGMRSTAEQWLMDVRFQHRKKK